MADNELTPRQLKALAELLNQPNLRAASVAAAVPERTLYNWLNEPAFETAYRKARREAVRHAVATLQRSAGAAAAALASIAEDAGEKAPARVAAARVVLELAIKAVELEDLAARVAALEEAYATKP